MLTASMVADFRFDIILFSSPSCHSLGRPLFSFRPPSIGLPFAINPRPRHVDGFGDTRITGAQKVDAPLNDIISYVFRDYVHTW